MRRSGVRFPRGGSLSGLVRGQFSASACRLWADPPKHRSSPEYRPGSEPAPRAEEADPRSRRRRSMLSTGTVTRSTSS